MKKRITFLKLILEDYKRKTIGNIHFLLKPFFYFNPKKYGIPFISELVQNQQPSFAREIIYCFWTSDNELTENRKKSLEVMRKNCGVKIELIDKCTLPQYILPEFPLHPAYEFLSAIHKADYLRCYFMHHYGGGYTDIKQHSYNWKQAFVKLNANQKKIALGYREKFYAPAEITSFIDNNKISKIDNLLRKKYKLLLGNGSFIFKPYTGFSHDWINELHHRLDLSYADLKKIRVIFLETIKDIRYTGHPF